MPQYLGVSRSAGYPSTLVSVGAQGTPVPWCLSDFMCGDYYGGVLPFVFLLSLSETPAGIALLGWASDLASCHLADGVEPYASEEEAIYLCSVT